MGNRLSRRREAPPCSAEAAAPEQKTAEEPAAAPAAEESVPAQTPEPEQNQEVVVGELVTPVACLPSEPCVAEEAPAAPEPEPEVKETPAPVQPEPPIPVSEPEPEPVAAPEPVIEAPIPEPEPAPIPEPTSLPEPEPVPEPISVPPPAEVPEPQILDQEPLPEPELPSPPLIDLGVPDEAPEPVDIPFIPEPVSAVEPADMIPPVEGGFDGTEDPVVSLEETTEFLENHVEVEVTEDLEQLVGDVENVNGLLKNLELKGDLLSDLIATDKIPDDSLITNMSTTAELM